MADFNNPLSNQGYLQLLASIVENNKAALTALEGVAPLNNLPLTAKRWGVANSRWETWDGTAWKELVALYEMKVRNTDQFNGQTEDFYRNAGSLNAGTLPAGQFNDTAHGVRGGGSLHALADGVTAGFMPPFEFNKIAGIEAGATADMTAGEILTALLTVDGAGSGLDADLLEGNQGSAYHLKSGNLSGLTNTTTARSNLGLGTFAQLNALNANTVGQSEIKETNQDISVIPGAAPTETLRTTAQFCFSGALAKTSPANYAAVAIEFTYPPVGAYSFTNTSYMKITPQAGGSDTYYMRAYHINSSPPYYSADGQILLFLFGIIDNATGILEGTCASIDPPWMYNGSTNTVADVRGDDGAGYLKKRLVEIEIPNWREMQLTGSLSNRKMISRRLKDDGFIYVPIDQSIKNADMNEVPHPFINVAPGKTIVYLDPVSKVIEDLHSHHILAKNDAAAPAASELLHDGYITIDPQSNLKRDRPTGLKCVSLKWKKTK